MASDSYWGKIGSCIRDSRVCSRMGRTINGVPETAEMFYVRHLTPIQVYSLISLHCIFFLFSSFLCLFLQYFRPISELIFYTISSIVSQLKKTLKEEILICFLNFETHKIGHP